MAFTRDSCLFYWDAGNDLAPVLPPNLAPSSSRASVAYAQDRTGTFRRALPGAPRTTWGLERGVYRPAYLHESSRTNLLLWSADFSNTAWGSSGEWTLASAPSIIAGQTARKHTNLGTTANRTRTQQVGTFTGSAESLSVIIERGNATDCHIGLRDNTAVTWAARVRYEWATGAMTLVDGAATAYWAETLARGVVRLHLVTSGTAGNIRVAYIYPTETAINSNYAIVHHAQLEAAAQPSSPIVTSGTSVTRSSDFLQFLSPPGFAGVPFLVYWKGWIDFPSAVFGTLTTRLVEMGQNDTSSFPRMILYYDSSGNFRFQLSNTASTIVSRSHSAVTAGTMVELLGVVNLSSQLALVSALAGGDGNMSAYSTAMTGGLSANPFLALAIGSQNNSSGASQAHRHATVKFLRSADATQLTNGATLLDEVRDFKLSMSGSLI